MAFLGRPSEGDSPFAIGDRARRDTSAPKLPVQKNPLPRRNSPNPGSNGVPVGGYMQTPSPYGSVSDEARRRYEERYAKKQADAAAAAAGPPVSPNPGSSNGRPPQGYPQQQQQQQQQQQHFQPSQLPPRQQFSPNPSNQQRPPPNHSQSYGGPSPQPIQQSYPPAQYPPQSQQTYGGRPGSLPQPPSGYQSPPPQQMQHQPPPQHQQQQQQRYSGPPGGAQQHWDQRPPSQQQHHQPQQHQQQQQWQQPAQVHSPPPPQMSAEDQELRSLFSQFDVSRSGQLNSYDLQKLLVKDATMEAREDCVKMLMNIFDTDRSGSINFVEFEGLYRYIKDWHGIFLRFDRDNSGTIDRKELHQALLGFGFSLPSDMVRKLEKRFAPPPGQGGREKGISFDRFLMACVTVKHFTEAFRRADTRGEGTLTLDYNQFMEMVLDAPS